MAACGAGTGDGPRRALRNLHAPPTRATQPPRPAAPGNDARRLAVDRCPAAAGGDHLGQRRRCQYQQHRLLRLSEAAQGQRHRQRRLPRRLAQPDRPARRARQEDRRAAGQPGSDTATRALEKVRGAVLGGRRAGTVQAARRAQYPPQDRAGDLVGDHVDVHDVRAADLDLHRLLRVLPAAAASRSARRQLPEQLHQEPRQALRQDEDARHVRRRGRHDRTPSTNCRRSSNSSRAPRSSSGSAPRFPRASC